MDDLKLLSAEVERIRHHMDLDKKYRIEDRAILIDIKNVLVGNDFNKGGMVQEVKDIKDELDELRTFKQEVNVYLKQAKFIIGGLILAIISITVKVFTK
ncbi:MAG: hypothetical protein RLZZ605_1426 [Bacteroidota bacterium]|jgi:hypothetical protein